MGTTTTKKKNDDDAMRTHNEELKANVAKMDAFLDAMEKAIANANDEDEDTDDKKRITSSFLCFEQNGVFAKSGKVTGTHETRLARVRGFTQNQRRQFGRTRRFTT